MLFAGNEMEVECSGLDEIAGSERMGGPDAEPMGPANSLC
jgi:hypothetical protein